MWGNPWGSLGAAKIIFISENYLSFLLKGITTVKTDPPSDSKDEDGNETKKPTSAATPKNCEIVFSMAEIPRFLGVTEEVGMAF